MSSQMLEPTPGQAIDRQAIALVKADVCMKTLENPHLSPGSPPQTRVSPKSFTDEANAIQAYLERDYYLLAPKAIGPTLNGHIVEMKQIHARLFRLNDEIRGLHTKYQQHGQDIPSTTTIVTVAFQLVELQDARHGLINKINKLFGIAAQEVLHGIPGTANQDASSTAAK